MAFNFIVLNIYFRFVFFLVALLLLPAHRVQSPEIHLTNIPDASWASDRKSEHRCLASTASQALTVQNCNNVYLNLNYCKFALHLKTLFYIWPAFAFLFFPAKNNYTTSFFFFHYFISAICIVIRRVSKWNTMKWKRKKKNVGQQERTLIKRNKLRWMGLRLCLLR